MNGKWTAMHGAGEKEPGGCEVCNGAWAIGIGRWAVLHVMGGGQGTMGTGQVAMGHRKKGEGTYVYKGCRCAWVSCENLFHFEEVATQNKHVKCLCV